jgi:hypothetical protein
MGATGGRPEELRVGGAPHSRGFATVTTRRVLKAGG